MRILRTLVVALALALFAAPALAFHCPVDMKKIDEALAGDHGLSSEQLAEVQSLRAQGEEQHNSGDHQAAVDTLAKAMAILGVE